MLSRVFRACAALTLALSLVFHPLPPRPTAEKGPVSPVIIHPQPNCGSTTTCP